MKKLYGLAMLLLFIIPSMTFAATFNHTLKYGTVGTDVSELQQFLADESLYYGPISATYNLATKNAVKSFQKQEGFWFPSGNFNNATLVDANNEIASHPGWTTTLVGGNGYVNVNGNHVYSPSTSSNGIPAGATAECRDGTYSFSLHHQGSCSHHSGVSQWLY